MNKMYGCAPVYFTGATLFFIGGGFFIHYDHPMLGTILLVPGLMLLGMTLFAWVMLYRINSSGGGDVADVNRGLPPQRTHDAAQKHHGRKQKKRP